MKLKSLIVSIAVLAVLAVFAFVARRPDAPAAGDARLNQPMIATALVEKASRLQVADQGRTVTLDRQPDGGWLVTSYHDLPADFQKLAGFVASLGEAQLQRLVTTNPDRIARLDFNGAKIELMDSAENELLSLALGKNPETGGGRFVRFGGESKAYLANFAANLDADSKNWANAEILRVNTDDVAKVEIPFAEGGTVTVSRAKKEDPWTAGETPDGQRLKADRVTSLLQSIGTLRFSDTAAPDDPNVAAARANLRSVKLTTFDQRTITVAMGRKPEEKKLKPPAAADGTGGPGALGSLSDLTKKNSSEVAGAPNPLAPEFETVPAGPAFVFVTNSDASAPINGWMQKRAFQIADFTYTGLPKKSDELFEPAPPPPGDAAGAKE